MKPIEFRSRLQEDNTLTVPPSVATQIPPKQAVRVFVFVDESSDDHAWADLTAEQFLQGYAESDAIYDQLPTG